MSAITWKLRKSPRADQCPVRGCPRCSRGLKNAKSTRAKLCSRHSMQLWRFENPDRANFTQIKDRATRKEIPFTITFEQYLEVIKDTAYQDRRGRWLHCYHIDRVDALKGYEPGNLRVITATQNCVKGATEDKDRRRAFVDAKLKERARQKAEREANSNPEPDPYSTHEATEDEPF